MDELTGLEFLDTETIQTRFQNCLDSALEWLYVIGNHDDECPGDGCEFDCYVAIEHYCETATQYRKELERRAA